MLSTQITHHTKWNTRMLRLLIGAHITILSILLDSEGKVSRGKCPLEANRWVKQRQAACRNNDHQALKNHEDCFVRFKECRVKSTRELDDTICASSEDRDSSRQESK